MAKRPVFHPDLGQFFESLRTQKKWGQSEAAAIAKRRGLKALTRQVLLRLESGKTKWPAPDVLRDMATLYGESYQRLVDQVTYFAYLASGTTVPDANSGTGVNSSPTPSRGSVDAATISSLQQKLSDLKAKYDELHDDVEGTIEHLSHHVGAKVTTSGTAKSSTRRHGKADAG